MADSGAQGATSPKSRAEPPVSPKSLDSPKSPARSPVAVSPRSASGTPVTETEQATALEVDHQEAEIDEGEFDEQL
ncbi:hypothetical protein IMZ48_35845 [Candidatus Bathyarchaeota archaeon]|nr:hypothetical protein [Candidatus Bathyarchaeota archaeon]